MGRCAVGDTVGLYSKLLLPPTQGRREGAPCRHSHSATSPAPPHPSTTGERQRKVKLSPTAAGGAF